MKDIFYYTELAYQITQSEKRKKQKSKLLADYTSRPTRTEQRVKSGELSRLPVVGVPMSLLIHSARCIPMILLMMTGQQPANALGNE